MMKKYFLILLLTAVSQLTIAQTVTLPNKVAEYYLEQDERAKQLDSLMNIRNSRIKNLELRLNAQKTIINTYKNDSISFSGIIETQKQQLSFADTQLALSRKEVKKQYRQKMMIGGVGLGAAIGSVIGQPLIGAGIGGGVGFVVSLFKKK